MACNQVLLQYLQYYIKYYVKLTGILDEYVVRLEIPVSDRRLAVVRIVTEYRAVQVLQAAVDATHRLKGI